MPSEINWNIVPNKNSIQKKALRQVIEKVGNCNQLALLLGISRAAINQWVYKECPKGKDLISPANAAKIEKLLKIKGIEEKLCPSQKK